MFLQRFHLLLKKIFINDDKIGINQYFKWTGLEKKIISASRKLFTSIALNNINTNVY